MDRKKQLKELYKNMKLDMGIIIVRSKLSNKCLLKTTNNIDGMLNRIRFQLEAGLHVNKELQKEWNEFGTENFVIEVLEKLEYDKDESKTDYTEELKLLEIIWEEKLTKEHIEFYKA